MSPITQGQTLYIVDLAEQITGRNPASGNPVTLNGNINALFLRNNREQDIEFTGDNSIALQIYPTYITAAPDFKLELKAWVADDKSFAMEIVFSGTQKGDFPGLPATGKRFSIRTCSFGEFENGKIKGRRDYWDLVTLREQLLGKLNKN